MTSSSLPPSSAPFVVRGEGYGVIEVTGPDRARWLHGLVTNEVKKLCQGEGNYSLFLTAKGKMIAECWVLNDMDRLMVLSRPDHAPTVASTLHNYLMMDDVNLTDARTRLTVVGLYGEPFDASMRRVVHVSEYGVPGLLWVVPHEQVANFVNGRAVADERTLEVRRIEAGTPRWGVDMDSDTIPVEVGLESRAISYDKGCYVGQEIIARIKTYGEPAKRLWGIRWSGEGPVAPKTPFTREARDAGWVTSSAASPALGSISLGYVKRTEGKAGAEVATPDGRTGTVVSLPFAH